MTDFNFPLGIAHGEYFCNRVSETKSLLHNIKSCTHTVLISPRRYGKTSLAYRAIEKSSLAHVKIDLYLATSPKAIERAIITGINTLISETESVTEKMLDALKSYIKSLTPVLEAGNNGFTLKLETKENSDVQHNICEALQILSQLLKKNNKKAVILIDEFQEVERVAKDKGIEGAIRHVAQETNTISFIFSGSKRNLLKSMFNDRNKPLYRLCDEIYVERIHEQDYVNFINKFSKKKWGKEFTEALFEKLVLLTECHPYYFNALLKSIFMKKAFPNVKTLEKEWQSLIDKKRKDIVAETKALTIIQKKLLVAIATGVNTELTGKKFLSQENLSGASVVRALNFLEEEDYVEKDANQNYFLIDPLMKSTILQLQAI